MLFPLANVILNTAKFLQEFSLSPLHGEQKEHPHRHRADFWQNNRIKARATIKAQFTAIRSLKFTDFTAEKYKYILNYFLENKGVFL